MRSPSWQHRFAAPSAGAPDAIRYFVDPPPAMRALFALLERMAAGRLALTTPDGATREFGPGGAPGAAALELADWSVAADALRGGDVAFAEAYIAGRWHTPDLCALLDVVAANRSALERAFHGRWWIRALLRVRHALRANTRRGAKRNVVAHYDLGNAFYALWLDPSMTYSAAWFDGNHAMSLEAAQHAKYARVLDELALAPGARVLEIGCGWGGFAEAAARRGLQVTAISLSDAQTAYARERIVRAGLSERVEFRLQDYRDVRGAFDGVASIEMIEAVGERWWPAYFRAVRNALAPGGRACIQAITIAEDRFDAYRRQSDFVRETIFPGGMLATPTRLIDEARAAGLELARDCRFGADYGATLKRWLRAFDARTPDVRALGFDERFVRCWRFYLAYCAAGFATRTTDVGQYTFFRR